jgi:hypothetical protein
MKRLLFCALGLVAAALTFTSRAQAQTNDVQYASTTNSELSDLYARLANLEARAATNNGGGGGCGCNDCCCGRSGFVAAGEIMWLKAYNSDNDFGEFNFREGYRVWFGWQGDSGLGARLRYFDYFQRANNGDFINIYALDAEIYDNVELGCYWDLLVGAGFRVFGYEDDDIGLGVADTALWGVGPVITAELYRHLGDRAALYAIGRQSIIVGSGDDEGRQQDDTGSVTELQLGLQLHTYWGDSLVFGRVGWETQAYYDIADDEELVTLMGAAFSGGIMY